MHEIANYLQVPQQHFEYCNKFRHHVFNVKDYIVPMLEFQSQVLNEDGSPLIFEGDMTPVEIRDYKIEISLPKGVSVDMAAHNLMKVVRKIQGRSRIEFGFIKRLDNSAFLSDREAALPETVVMVHDLEARPIGQLIPSKSMIAI